MSSGTSSSVDDASSSTTASAADADAENLVSLEASSFKVEKLKEVIFGLIEIEDLKGLKRGFCRGNEECVTTDVLILAAMDNIFNF